MIFFIGSDEMVVESKEGNMIKFWKEDFTYVKRAFISFTDECEYRYDFAVRGESANYLMNKYGLAYPNVKVHLWTVDNSVSVTSKSNNKLLSDVDDLDDKDDLVELLPILLEEVARDLRNYEEYMCNSDCYHKDSRWY